MYFPRGFDCRLAIELGGLVGQAYEQYAAFEEGKPWKIARDYELLCELSHPSGKEMDLDRNKDSRILELGKFFGLKVNESKPIPIGFLAQRGRRVFVIFRGTKTPKEWINNLSMGLKAYPVPGFGEVHEGFLQIYDSVKKQIADCLGGTGPGKKIYVAGHSLGAALATFALPDIEARLARRTEALYTFGSPRVGDSSFAESFNDKYGQRSFRIANTSDIVTSVPLPIPLAGLLGGYFSHIDTPIDFTRQANDIEVNHSMKTYLSELIETSGRRGFLSRLFGGNRQTPTSA